jgi:hypothetical protein
MSPTKTRRAIGAGDLRGKTHDRRGKTHAWQGMSSTDTGRDWVDRSIEGA